MLKDTMTSLSRTLTRTPERLVSAVTRRASWSRALEPALILVIITLIAWLSVMLAYRIVSMAWPAPTPAAMHAQAAQPTAAARVALADYAIIAERNLFKTTRQAIADEEAAALGPAGEEYTAFDLKGTIAVDDEIGFVIVEERGKGSQKLYRLGEMIGSARLIAITRNTAILMMNGRQLVMRVRELADGTPAPRTTAGTAVRPLSGRDTTGVQVSRQEVTESLADLKSIMSQAVVRPFMSEGVMEGYIISNIVPGSLYERLGLQNGDVIVDVNGQNLDSADDLLQLVNVMQAGGSISVNLKRGGNPETINYTFQ